MPEKKIKKPFIDDDLKEKLKRETDILDVFRLFGLADSDLKPTNDPDQFKAKCIFADCPPAKEKDYPLGINTAEKKWNCFHCGRGGDLLALIQKFKGLDFHHSKLFLLEMARGTNQAIQDLTQTDKKPAKPPKSPTPPEPKRKIIYKPFRRRLTGLRVEGVPALETKGISSKTAKKFGVGYCSQGMMKGRIVVPIHNSRVSGTEDKEILCYAGYSLTKRAKEFGDWRFPDGFEKAKHLFNLNRIKAETKTARETLNRHGLIVVESFWNVFKLYQAGIKNVVALMGTNLSVEQEQLLLQTTDKVKLWLDEDEAGLKALQNILRTPEHGGKNGLMYKTHVQVIKPSVKLLIGGEQVKPYQFGEGEIGKILEVN